MAPARTGGVVMVLVSNAGAILSIVALLVAAVAVAYSALIRTTISTLKDSNAAQAERISILEKQGALDSAEIRRITTENQVLRGVVSGAEQIASVRAEVAQHHHDVTVWQASASEALMSIREILERP